MPPKIIQKHFLNEAGSEQKTEDYTIIISNKVPTTSEPKSFKTLQILQSDW